MIYTIESICDDVAVFFKKKVLTLNLCLVCPVIVNYEDFSTITSAVVSTALLLKKNPKARILFPVSFNKLRSSEFYDVTIQLMKAMGLCRFCQTIFSLDASPHDALAEHLDDDKSVLATLEELTDTECSYRSSERDSRVFSEHFKFVHILRDDVYRPEVYKNLIDPY